LAALWPVDAPELCNEAVVKLSRRRNEPADIRVAPQEPWYKYGVAVLLFEIAVAIAISGYSLYITFNGLGGFPGKHLVASGGLRIQAHAPHGAARALWWDSANSSPGALHVLMERFPSDRRCDSRCWLEWGPASNEPTAVC
jgi:hypothetical protein